MTILYEDNHLIIVNKSSSEIVHADKTGDVSLEEELKLWLKNTYNKPGNVFLGVTHRLDRPVSGVVIFAKTSKALIRLNELFRKGEIRKGYFAIVRNLPPQVEGRLEHYLWRNEKQNKSYVCQKTKPGTKKAILDYTLVGRSDRYALLKIDLKTGRHHQIRCQLAAIGCPIKGDLKYGYPRSNPNKGISLHAAFVQFVHPVSQLELNIQAPFPEDEKLWAVFEQQGLLI